MGTQLSARHNQETKNVLQRPVNESLKMEIFNVQVTGTRRFYAAVCLFSNKSQMMSKSVKTKSDTRCSYHILMSSTIYLLISNGTVLSVFT